ncbi:MAG: ribbon-helix-helix domain-containing protein, partial [Bacillota bacterium]
MERPNHELQKAYQKGLELQKTQWMDIVYGELVPDFYFTDPVANLFFTAGKEGRPMPEWVEGWRYGEIPRIVVRLPELLLSRLDAEVKRLGVRRSDIVRIALAQYLNPENPERKEDDTMSKKVAAILFAGTPTPYAYGVRNEAYALIRAGEIPDDVKAVREWMIKQRGVQALVLAEGETL